MSVGSAPSGRGTGAGNRPLRLRLEQMAPRRLAVAHNRSLMEERARVARADGVDLLVFPELATTGYDVGARAAEVALEVRREGAGLSLPSEAPTVVFGAIERSHEGLLHNVAVAARGNAVVHVHRKAYLPTYGSFDEGRIFSPGRGNVRPHELVPGWRTGMLVCEDLWHPALAYLLALRGADLIVVPAAAPGRGPASDDADGPTGVDSLLSGGHRFASSVAWELLARTTALVHGCWVALVNRAGVEGAVTFAGGSLVVDPRGRVRGRCVQEGTDRLDVELDREEVTGARASFSHLRDEDVGLLLAEARAILGERAEP